MSLSSRAVQSVRGFMSTAIRRSGHGHHDEGGIPGNNLPFGIQNRYKLTLYFALFFGSGFAIPFLLLRHQLLKK
uniref:Cytochrome c oxidase subunit 7C, mitochondrial n=1 Tax=Hemiscolopendra marginata TaxID=943146 RepID=A0A646QIH8_9MYRI